MIHVDPNRSIDLMCISIIDQMHCGHFTTALESVKKLLNQCHSNESKRLPLISLYIIACHFARSKTDVELNSCLPPVSGCTVNLDQLELRTSISLPQTEEGIPDKQRYSLSKTYMAKMKESNHDFSQSKMKFVRRKNKKKINRRRKLRKQKYLNKLEATKKYDLNNPIPEPIQQRWTPRAL